MSIELSETRLADLVARITPMLEQVQRNYLGRAPEGYPAITGDVRRGHYGIQLDPNFSFFLTTDGERLFTETTYRSWRSDTRSSASREKFGGMTISDRRPIEGELSDQDLRNLVAELLARFNTQPGIIRITDD